MTKSHFGEETDSYFVASLTPKKFGDLYFSIDKKAGKLLIVAHREERGIVSRRNDYAEVSLEITELDTLIEILREARQLMWEEKFKE